MNQTERNLFDIDRQHLWHPFTQHYQNPEPLLLEKAQGAYVYTSKGEKLFDSGSSWWVNLHGHANPQIQEAIHQQFQQLDHVIFAGATHAPGIQLAKNLVKILPNEIERVFYSDNGSTAVEVALKMALQFCAKHAPKRKLILALENSYHGDTFGAMAVGQESEFNQAFRDYLFPVLRIPAPLRTQKRGLSLDRLHKLCQKHGKQIAAIIYEPLVQGAGGMLMHDTKELEACLRLAREEGILCIADEVMTGFGRTGKIFASDHMNLKPDIICLAKGLTGGTIPLSVTACTERIFQGFLDCPEAAFFHGHSYTGNPIACAAANASLKLLQSSDCLGQIEAIGQAHSKFIAENKSSDYILRQTGTILACEIRTKENSGYFNQIRQKAPGFFRERGILLRPLGNVLYCIPPYCTEVSELDNFYTALREFASQAILA